MPWCQPCARFYSPNSMTSEGDCPSCGTHLADAEEVAPSAALQERRAAAADDAPSPTAHTHADADAEEMRTPWHFWVLLAMAALYLGWRALQGILLLF